MKNRKVILIDDNAWEHVAGKLKGLFAMHDLELEVLASVDAAQPLVRDKNARCPADLFVIDVMMPAGVIRVKPRI
jgi:DNA-binding response OmpR family regulator